MMIPVSGCLPVCLFVCRADSKSFQERHEEESEVLDGGGCVRKERANCVTHKARRESKPVRLL